jgi:hypothetical protein
MNDALLKVYHRLPPPLRSVAASVQGYYLRWWRYGPETDRPRLNKNSLKPAGQPERRLRRPPAETEQQRHEPT